MKFIGTDEVEKQHAQRKSLNHLWAACFQMWDSMPSRWRQRSVKKETETPRDVMFLKKKKKPLMVEWAHWRRHNGKAHPDSHVDFHLTTAKWGTREHARNERRLVQKENNLLSVASIHFHSEGQELFLDNRVMNEIAGIDWQKTATKVLNKYCTPYRSV